MNFRNNIRHKTIFAWAILTILMVESFQGYGQIKLNHKLIEACKAGSLKKAEKLIKKGANVNYLYAFNITPILIASINSNKDLVRLLLDKGADPSIQSDCYYAKFFKRIPGGKYELQVGKKQYGKNAIIAAIEKGNGEIFKLFLENKVNFDFEYQPDIQVRSYSVPQLYSAPISVVRMIGKDALNKTSNVFGIQVKRSLFSPNTLVCIVDNKPIEPKKLTPLKAAVFHKNKNYFIIEKLAELSSRELNNDLDKMTERINDSKTNRILRKYEFIN